ncbi:MAG: hypothetical protein ACFCU4_10315 [Puniceicoccaceae bacterium]
MARKVDLDILKAILTRNELDVRKVAEILEDLNRELDREEDEPKPPPVKKQFTILVSDPNGLLQDKDLVGWVVQIPEEDSPVTALDKLYSGAYTFNASPKGRRFPVETVGEACEFVPAKFFKDHQIWVKTKEPVLIVRSDNRIPKD